MKAQGQPDNYFKKIDPSDVFRFKHYIDFFIEYSIHLHMTSIDYTSCILEHQRRIWPHNLLVQLGDA